MVGKDDGISYTTVHKAKYADAKAFCAIAQWSRADCARYNTTAVATEFVTLPPTTGGVRQDGSASAAAGNPVAATLFTAAVLACVA